MIELPGHTTAKLNAVGLLLGVPMTLEDGAAFVPAPCAALDERAKSVLRRAERRDLRPLFWIAGPVYLQLIAVGKSGGTAVLVELPPKPSFERIDKRDLPEGF